jgi:hypothetical protein
MSMTALRTHDERHFAEAGPGDCPARYGGMAGYWLCERPRGHEGWHRDTQEDGQVLAWQGMSEISGCVPENNADLTVHVEQPGCDHS